MTQDGTQKLIARTLEAKEMAALWRAISLILAEALAALDINDIEEKVEPYSSAAEIAACIKDDKVVKLLKILNIG